MTDQVLESYETRAYAESQLSRYAAAVKALGMAPYMGVKLKQVRGAWQIIMVDRRGE